MKRKSADFVDAEPASIEKVLSTYSVFHVPKYQRNYAWRDDRVDQLWVDILENFDDISNNPEHADDYQYLLGSIVLVKSKEKTDITSYVIVDGQQRLATLTMLFCASRNIMVADAEHDESKRLAINENIPYVENMINNVDSDKTPKLILNDTDKKLFREMQRGNNIGPKPKQEASSCTLIRNNYKFLKKKLLFALNTDFNPAAEDDPDKLEFDPDEESARNRRIENYPRLLEFLRHVTNNNHVIQLTVHDEDAASQIFETLNERGKPLSKSNLIKNLVLRKCNDQSMEDELSNRWNAIFDVKIKDRDDDFIMESYNSRNSDKGSLRKKLDEKYPNTRSKKYMTKKNMYKIIKSMIDNKIDSEKLISELETDASFLDELNNPSKYFDDETRDDIKAIKTLQAKYIRIAILAAYRRWHEDNYDDYRRLVNLLVKFFFKIRTVRGTGPSKIEKTVESVTKMINSGSSFDDVLKRVKEDDNHELFLIDFRNRFAISPSPDNAKYVLLKITMKLGSNRDDVKPIKKLTLEHVLPKNYKAHWNERDFFNMYEGRGDSLEEFVDRLGNLTLLNPGINATLRDQDFHMKKTKKDRNGNLEGYDGSNLEINKKTVCNYEKWTAQTVDCREKTFTTYASKIWSLD